MAIFGKKQKKETTKKADTKLVVKKSVKKTTETQKTAKKRKTIKGSPKSNFSQNLSAVLIRPRITEKATFQAEKNVYVFEIMKDATKKDVILAIEHFYKVKPIKVNMTKIPSKIRMSRKTRKKGVKSEGKKAYVFLKKDDRIEIV